MELKLEVLTDSTANLGMHNSIGSGREWHLDVEWLWTQEAGHAGRFSLKKVGTYTNVSDLTDLRSLLHISSVFLFFFVSPFLFLVVVFLLFSSFSFIFMFFLFFQCFCCSFFVLLFFRFLLLLALKFCFLLGVVMIARCFYLRQIFLALSAVSLFWRNWPPRLIFDWRCVFETTSGGQHVDRGVFFNSTKCYWQ